MNNHKVQLTIEAMKGKVYSRLLCFIEGSVTQLIQQLEPHQVWRHVLAIEVDGEKALSVVANGRPSNIPNVCTSDPRTRTKSFTFIP